VGDITKVNLSDEIPNDVQTVIHTAATVKHYGSYQYFYDVNVQGTKNVVDYAKSINAKMIHISTLSVSTIPFNMVLYSLFYRNISAISYPKDA
jgi:thioester reductase-like protein